QKKIEELLRSNRRVKEFKIIKFVVSNDFGRKLVSYRDTLLRAIVNKHDSRLLEDKKRLMKIDSKGDEPIPDNDVVEEKGKLKEDLRLIDLGYDFFFAKLENDKDYEQVIKGGLWFIGGRFLAMRKRAPNFKALEATFDSVAMWVRLHELPIEYYDSKIFTKIVWSLGVPLWTDNFTMSSERGKFTRLCMQVDLNKPLRK
ncbi:hypothetical protein Gotri_018031, partial [Gossypium trilobum]|nr:hypothetical protein [Gossypium trilobum]